MTVVVAFLCSDGVVVAADSMLTPNVGNIGVGHHKGRKVHIIAGPQVSAFAGDVGLGARFRVCADASQENIARVEHPLPYCLGLAQAITGQFQATGIWPNVDIATILAFAHGGAPQCCAFMGRVQPWLLDRDHYYVALGSGKLSADPFLRFLADIFCQNGQPNVREAVFLAVWTVQHVIDTNPGGVAGPIRIAVLERDANGAFAARELAETEIGEHLQATESAAQALRTWRDSMQSGEAADGVAEPPEMPANPEAPA